MKEFQKNCLNHHNELRATHGAPPLKLNAELSAKAQQWAEHCASSDTLEHNPDLNFNGETCGENLYMSEKPPDVDEVPSAAWYDEMRHYNPLIPGLNSKTEHFTQMIWAGSKELGVGAAQNLNGKFYMCCNYLPAGNVMPAENFETNVLYRPDNESPEDEERKISRARSNACCIVL